MLHLSEDERSALERSRNSLPNRITPYYASLLDRDDPSAAAPPHDGDGEPGVRAHARREDRPAERRRRQPGSWTGAPLSRPRAVPRHGHVSRVLPVLHALADRRQPGRRVRVQHHAVGTRDRLHRAHARDPRCAPLRRRSAAPVGRSPRVGAVAPPANPARRVPPHRHQGARRAAAAHHAGARRGCCGATTRSG